MNRTLFIRRITSQLSALLSGQRVAGLTLADVGSESETRATLDALSRKVPSEWEDYWIRRSERLPRVESLPLAAVWKGGAA